MCVTYFSKWKLYWPKNQLKQNMALCNVAPYYLQNLYLNWIKRTRVVIANGPCSLTKTENYYIQLQFESIVKCTMHACIYWQKMNVTLTHSLALTHYMYALTHLPYHRINHATCENFQQPKVRRINIMPLYIQSECTCQ